MADLKVLIDNFRVYIATLRVAPLVYTRRDAQSMAAAFRLFGFAPATIVKRRIKTANLAVKNCPVSF